MVVDVAQEGRHPVLDQVALGPLEDTEFLRSISTIYKVDRIKCPLMIAHGANDPRVPLHEAEQLNAMMKELAASFANGSSALFVLVRKATPDKVLEGLKQFAGKGKVLRTSLAKDSEEALRAVLERA